MEIWIGLAMFAALLALLAIGVPVAFGLFGVGIAALFLVDGGGFDALGLVAPTLWGSVTSFTLTAVPLFILMGAIISASGMGSRLYGSLATLMHGVPGGLLVSTTLACTVMAAVSGSSVATAGAIGRFSVNEMRRFGYRDSAACGAVAAGGTLGILIPPSIPMIVYGIVAEQSIGRLFIAGVVPGLLMAGAFIAYQVYGAIQNRPATSPAGAPTRVGAADRLRALVEIAPVAVLIWIILGSIYEGIATPTEAAALGTLASLVLSGALYRELTWRKMVLILEESARGSVMVLMIIAGAMVFGYAMTSTQVAPVLSRTVASLDVSPWLVFIAINLLLVFLGCFMETLSIIVITTPILVPIISAFGWDLVWFGIILTINMELALITPPVGLNLFVVQGVVRDVPLERIIAGALPYVLIMAAVLALVAIFPGLAMSLIADVR